MQPDLFITSFCLISDNKVIKNGQVAFEKSGNAESFLNETYSHFQIAYSKFHKMDSLCKLGFLCAEILLEGNPLDKKYSNAETGIVLSNANASLDTDLKYVKTISTGASPALFVYTLPNIVIGEISIRHNMKGENAFFVFKQFNANFIEEYVKGLFNHHLLKACICGWVDFLK